jgi:hypothetical protein
MLTPISPGVLLIAALISSPALWSAFADGTMPIDVALTRYLITVLVAWALLSVAKSYVTNAHQQARRQRLESTAAGHDDAASPASAHVGAATSTQTSAPSGPEQPFQTPLHPRPDAA